jgi:MOSC domain-containing protein
MPRVRAIHVCAVKSLHLTAVQEAIVGRHGIDHDRRFLLVDGDGRVATQRRFGVLAQVACSFDARTGMLELRLPGAPVVRDVPVPAGRDRVELWGREVAGTVIDGAFARTLSELVGRELRMVRTDDDALGGVDSHPVSVLSQASVDAVARRGGRDRLDARRFRPSLLIDGCDAHAEDAWVGRAVRVGEAVLRVVRLDPRCAMTTLDPDTGERDADTLRWLAGYRPRVDGEVCCGVYADVERPGRVRVGDSVEPAA